MSHSVITGNSLEVLEEIESESIHAVITDPPYGLAFMGRDWDDFEPKEYQEWCEEWARKAKQVLKPGGHLVAFSGNRTHHRLFTGVEDAGFEIRDTLTWHYGSGFPKASDISKTIDKREGAEREVVGQYSDPDSDNVRTNGANSDSKEVLNDDPRSASKVRALTEPATEKAKEWEGWKTGLKPATEFIVLARKPFSGATVDCVLEHGTGGLNIGVCRIETDDKLEYTVTNQRGGHVGGDNSRQSEPRSPEGRYPSNVVFDAIEAERLDNEVGELEGPWGSNSNSVNEDSSMFGVSGGVENEKWAQESGGPSRYFYTSKASKTERTEDGSIENTHPTVKPQDLMEWLVKLVTKDGQHILDPFAGSDTTGKAAKELGRQFILIEKSEKWADVARARCGLTPENPSILTEENQNTLTEFGETDD